MTLAAPPAPPASTSATPRWRRMVAPGAVVGGLAAATVALHLRDPHSQGSWGACPFALLGIDCPGCGGLRAVNDLTNAQFVSAASSNLLLILAAPFILYTLARWTWSRWTGTPWSMSDRALMIAGVTLLVAMVLFTVLRNTAAGSWLAP